MKEKPNKIIAPGGGVPKGTNIEIHNEQIDLTAVLDPGGTLWLRSIEIDKEKL